MTGWFTLLVSPFIAFIAVGVPIAFSLGMVSLIRILSLDTIPNMVVFSKMFNGLNSFTLLAVPLFILAANLMNSGAITKRLIDVCVALVGHVRGGLAHANITGKDVFDTLSPEDQAIIREAATQSVPVQRNACSLAEMKAAKFLEGDKCEVVTNTRTTSMFTAHTASIYDQYEHYSEEIALIKSIK